jgi:plastocyanin
MRKLFATAALALGLAAPGTPIAAQSQPSALTVHIKNFMFAPLTATIDAGDRVTFVNDDDEAHTATAVDHSFDSEGLDAHASFQHVFTKPGTYRYFCELHPYMKATIVVRAAGAR